MFAPVRVSLRLGILCLGACGGQKSVTPDAPLPATVSEELGTAGGSITLDGQATLDIPAGALATTTTISISQSNTNVPSDALGRVYRFEPSGLVFSQPVMIRLALPSNASSGRVFWSRPDGVAGFDALPTVISGGNAEAAISHFSFGYVGPDPVGPRLDAGVGPDAGPGSPDGGLGPDGGITPDGGGPRPDGGPLPSDGGPLPPDGPLPPHDGGSFDGPIPVDGGGPTPPDAGVRL